MKMANPATLPTGYISISESYSYAPSLVGLTLRNARGAEVYVQPGDDESAMRETIEALDELPDNRRDIIADMALADYFEGIAQ
jgi:hypothetical protein